MNLMINTFYLFFSQSENRKACDVPQNSTLKGKTLFYSAEYKYANAI